jgi:prolyl oligopeptidase
MRERVPSTTGARVRRLLRSTTRLGAVIATGLVLAPGDLHSQQPPRSARVDTVAGSAVPDPYRALESLDPEGIRALLGDADAATRALLRQLPLRDELARAVAARARLDDSSIPRVTSAGAFALRVNGRDGTRAIVRLGDDADTALPVPAPAGMTVANFAPSPAGALLAVEFAEEGGARRLVRVVRPDAPSTVTAELAGARISPSPWLDDARLLVTVEGGAGPDTLHAWSMADGRREMLAVAPSARAALSADVTSDGAWLVIRMRAAGREAVQVAALESGSARALRALPDGVSPVGSLRGELIALTESSAGRQVAAVDAATGTVMRVLAPATQGRVIEAAFAFGDRLVVQGLEGPRPVMEVRDADGTLLHTPPVPLGLIWTDYLRGWAGVSGDAAGRFAYFRSISLAGPGIYRIDLRSGAVEPFRLRATGVAADRFTSRVVEVTSSDGERFPMILLHARTRSGPADAPTLVYAYGAYGFTPVPFFNAKYLALLERGGLLAIPFIRGGGVKGPAWHRAGSGRNKPNTVNDLIAAAEWLIAHGEAFHGGVAVEGQGPGGLAAAAAALRAPALWSAVILDAPITDPVRDQAHTNARVGELGSIADPDDVAAMLVYSPYHRALAATAHPPTLIRFGDRDTTVPPFHALKLWAALRDVPGDEHVRVAWAEGHGFLRPADRLAAEWTDDLAFVWRSHPTRPRKP